MPDEPRPEVIAAGAEVLSAAVAYIDGREDSLPPLTRMALYQRLERAVIAFHEVTDA